jgi:DNA helicase-2/ATP-dependent DNA helicase PcrA
LIEPFTSDIKDILFSKLAADIADLTIKINKAKNKNGKTALSNAYSLESKQRRLNDLEKVERFTYSPSSNKVSLGTINHSEVINIGATFLAEQELMQKVLINRYPILLIDESQDTNKALLESFISVQENHKSSFSLGLFGDMMQRIYSGGKDDLTSTLPAGWKMPAKKINYRCPKRVIKLINEIRKESDNNTQNPKKDAIEGIVRLFIVNSDTSNKLVTENVIRQYMAEFSLDEKWNIIDDVKTLTLEHAMAANRGGFDDFLAPLSTVNSLKDGALNGSNKIINFLTTVVLPFINSVLEDDIFEVTRLIKKNSLLFSDSNVLFTVDPLSALRNIDDNVSILKKTLEKESVLLRDVLSNINLYKLLTLPEELESYLVEADNKSLESEEDSNLASDKDKAWSIALNANIEHVKNYASYISGNLGYATHQGVKGLEFQRVMAILDDESKGFLFDYEKLFGAKELTKKDIENEDLGKDSAISRTRRLFYVICSRAEQSLAVVAYSNDPIAVKQKAIQSRWFNENEIISL